MYEPSIRVEDLAEVVSPVTDEVQSPQEEEKKEELKVTEPKATPKPAQEKVLSKKKTLRNRIAISVAVKN